MFEAVYSKHTNHPDIATSYKNLGNVHEHLGDCNTALKNFTKSLKLMKAVYDENTNSTQI